MSIIENKEIRLDCEGRSYGRKTCFVFVGDVDVGLEQIKAGLAWDSPKYSRGKYRLAQEQAKAAKSGIWSLNQRDLVSPHCFRHKRYKQCESNPIFMP